MFLENKTYKSNHPRVTNYKKYEDKIDSQSKSVSNQRLRDKLENTKQETYKVLVKAAKNLEKNNKQQHKLRIRILAAELEAQKATKAAAEQNDLV